MPSRHHCLSSLKKNLAHMKTLPRKQWLPFIWDYYRVTIVTLAAAVLLAGLVIGTVARTAAGILAPRQSISLAVAADNLSDCQDWISRFSGSTCTELPLDLLLSAGYAGEGGEFEVKLVCWVAAGQPDVLICDKATLEYCLSQELLGDLAACLPEAAEGTLWLDISDTALEKACVQDGSSLYLCRPLSGRTDTASVAGLIQALLIK